MFEAKNPKGQGLVEYILIAVLVGIVVWAAWLIVGPVAKDVLDTIIVPTIQAGG